MFLSMDPDIGEYQGNKGTGTGGRWWKDPNRGQKRKGAVKVVALLFYVRGRHLRSCRDGQLT